MGCVVLISCGINFFSCNGSCVAELVDFFSSFSRLSDFISFDVDCVSLMSF
ncbi:hypothetical protein ['Camptotheca acuminata' phytoplasma]|uniref:hypothetical protein n=1 Tax='Camptotheca acuminata' phytoplasma TaxID=3239192 RepID=UPI00351A1700